MVLTPEMMSDKMERKYENQGQAKTVRSAGRGRWKRTVCMLTVIMLTLTACQGRQETPQGRVKKKKINPYGVFIGIDSEEISRLDDYQTIVVEPSEFSRKQIQSLQDQGKTVFAYLNIGTVETFRSYYDRFKGITLGIYGDWPDEYWVDVSSKDWQNHCVSLAREIQAKGFDGFFIDNLDVYNNYPRDDVYRGLCAILRRLKTLDTELIINGAKEFVLKTFTMDMETDLFDAVNQEEVFTRIDFDDESYHNQKVTETLVLQKYLGLVKEEGYKVYLLEYSPGPVAKRKIKNYCDHNGFLYYCAPSLKLE